MAGRREKPEEIGSKLRQVEVLQGQGATIAEAVRPIGVTEQAFHRWRKHGAIDAPLVRAQWRRAKRARNNSRN